VRGILVNGFQAKTTIQTLSVFKFFTNQSITFLADSNLFGLKSSASILPETSRAITISIQFFLTFSEIFILFGLARIAIKLIKINNNKIILK
jgi:hypothetical protein